MVWLCGLAVSLGAEASKPGSGGSPTPSEPPPRFWHAFTSNGASTAANSRLYVFGGQGGTTAGSPVMLGDFWYYQVDTGQWRIAPTGRTKPGVRDGVGLSCGDGECLLTNGRRGSLPVETWRYTEATATWTQYNCRRFLCPPGRGFPAAAYDPIRKQHVVFGGQGGDFIRYLNDTYTFQSGRWVQRTQGPTPPDRETAAAAFAGGLVNMVVMYGGAYMQWYPSGFYGWAARCDMWAWDGQQWLAVTQKNSGPCLAFPAVAWDTRRQQLVVASGETVPDGVEYVNRDVWYFTFDSSTSGSWTRDTTSGFFSCASNASPLALMAHDAASGANVFFGGGQNTSQGVVAYANTTVCH